MLPKARPVFSNLVAIVLPASPNPEPAPGSPAVLPVPPVPSPPAPLPPPCPSGAPPASGAPDVGTCEATPAIGDSFGGLGLDFTAEVGAAFTSFVVTVAVGAASTTLRST